MKPMLALMALSAAACSPAPPDPQNRTEPPPAVAPTAMQAAEPAPAEIADSHAVPKPGELKTFGDWTVGCDNVRTCTLASLGPEGVDFPAVTIALTRAAGPDGRIALALTPHQDAGPAAQVAVDGTRFDPATQAAAFAAAMANGMTVTIRDAKGAVTVTQSLKGASAALRYVDAMQGRAGGVAALVARGPTPAAAVPAAQPVPTIVAIAPGGTAAKPDAALLATLRKQAGCEAPGANPAITDTIFAPEADALGDGATLVAVPCSIGAYNVSSALFVTRGGRTVPATIDAPSGFAATGAETAPVPGAVNIVFKDGVLTSYAKGRGLGDCGSTQAFVWDGERLRLSAQSDMGECRGNPDYVPTWRAKVVRR